MKKVITVRASSVPRLLECNQAAFAKVPIDVPNEMARIGSAAHEAGAAYITNGQVLDTRELALRHNIDDNDELEYLIGSIRHAWEAELSKRFPDIVVEDRLEVTLHEDDDLRVVLSGSPDGISHGATSVGVLDWKSGRLRENFYFQVEAYALLCSEVSGMTKATATVVWLRDRQWENFTFNESQLQWLKKAIVSAVTAPQKTYRVGEHCVYCPRFAECPARRNMVAQSMMDIHNANSQPTIAVKDVGTTLAAGKCVKKAVDEYRDLLMHQIKHLGASIPVGEGRELVAQPVSRRVINARKAWPILKKELTDDQLAEITSLGVGKVQKAIQANATSGSKKERSEAIMAALDTAGALKSVEHEQLREIETERGN